MNIYQLVEKTVKGMFILSFFVSIIIAAVVLQPV